MAKNKISTAYFSDPEFYGLTRKKGWKVGISRGGKWYYKFFSDGQHGGNEGAFAAAKAYRDELLRTVLPISRSERWSQLRNDNTSGMSGVYRKDVTYNTKNGRKRMFAWIAEFKSNGTQLKKYFSILKYGEDGARQRAEEARQKMLAQIEGVHVYSPAAKALSTEATNPSQDQSKWTNSPARENVVYL